MILRVFRLGPGLYPDLVFLVGATGGDSSSYVYDATGNLPLQTDNKVTTLYLLDDHSVLVSCTLRAGRRPVQRRGLSCLSGGQPAASASKPAGTSEANPLARIALR
jgi:hypothetical protein